MSKIGQAISELRRAENILALDLLRMSDRHHADAEVHFVARDLARWSDEHVRQLAEIGRSHGLELDPQTDQPSRPATWLRQRASDLKAGTHEPASQLLADLRQLHQDAARVSLDWEVLAQSAQAVEDQALLEVAESCHPQTLRQMRWANATLKEVAAQAMVTP